MFFFFGSDANLIPFPGPQVTWAGACPCGAADDVSQAKHLCVATDNGTLYFCDVHGTIFNSAESPQNLESINGVAFTPAAMAVSTPGEILITMGSAENLQPRAIPIEQGAYGIIHTRSGGFIATLGKKGLLHLKRQSDVSFLATYLWSKDIDIFFYKVVSVGAAEDGGEFFACAGRNNGLVTVMLDANDRPKNIWFSKGEHVGSNNALDVIDVTPAPTPDYPFAVLYLGIDGTLHFNFDIRHESRTVGLRLLGLKGTPYSVLAANGHIFVLTSDEFCVFPELLSSFIGSDPLCASGERVS